MLAFSNIYAYDVMITAVHGADPDVPANVTYDVACINTDDHISFSSLLPKRSIDDPTVLIKPAKAGDFGRLFLRQGSGGPRLYVWDESFATENC